MPLGCNSDVTHSPNLLIPSCSTNYLLRSKLQSAVVSCRLSRAQIRIIAMFLLKSTSKTHKECWRSWILSKQSANHKHSKKEGVRCFYPHQYTMHWSWEHHIRTEPKHTQSGLDPYLVQPARSGNLSMANTLFRQCQTACCRWPIVALWWMPNSLLMRPEASLWKSSQIKNVNCKSANESDH